MEIALILTLLSVLGAEFMNGFTDAPNAITTMVSTRTLALRWAIVLAIVFNVAGVFAGTAVAKVIGKGIVESDVINLTTVSAAMISVIIWSAVAWKFGLPTSESHALVAALAGAGLATAGPGVLLTEGWRNVGIGLFFSTFLGLFAAYAIAKITRSIAAPFPPRRTRPAFRWLQILSSSFMAFGHGSNDGQKFIGVFALALFLGGFTEMFFIPTWVIIVCAITMGMGTSFGGWRIIRTMGLKMVKIETYQGFSAETAAGGVIALASLVTLPLPGNDLQGIPLSTTHTIGTSIVGATIARRRSLLRLGIARNIALAWILTFPICALLAFSITHIARLFF